MRPAPAEGAPLPSCWRSPALSLLAALAVLPPAASASGPDPARAAVVTLRVTGQEWNWKTPWSKQAPWTRTLTGLVVPGPAILVSSPAIGNHLLLEVQKLGQDRRTPARLVLSDPEGPLALLAVDDPGFFQGTHPLPFAERAPVDGELTVYRWLRAGQLEASRASARQVRAARHGNSRTSLLSFDAASSLDGAGDSEVIVKDGMVVGLATAKQGETLTAIASPVLRQFLEEAAHTPYRGFARAGVAWQELTNPALRAFLGLTAEESGVRLTRVLPHGSGAGLLEEGDVLLEVAGQRLDPTGQFEHPLYGRLLFPLLFTDGRAPGDILDLEVLRGEQRLTLKVPLRRMLPEDDRIPPYVQGHGPDYAVYGGLVFEELSVPYLATWSDWSRRAPTRLLVAYDREGAVPSPDKPRLVLLSSVLPDAANLGYQDLRDLLVTAVNGTSVGSLEDVRHGFAKPEGGFHVVEFLPGQGPTRIVLDVAEVAAAAARIRSVFSVEAEKVGP